jgi:Myb-like DNA-binding domain
MDTHPDESTHKSSKAGQIPELNIFGEPYLDTIETSSHPPPQKKGRTNASWSVAEEQRLKHMMDRGKSWSEIAKTFPNRTERSVKKFWYKVGKSRCEGNGVLTDHTTGYAPHSVRW